MEHPITQALQRFRAREPDAGAGLLEAWCVQPSTNDAERALAWHLIGLMRCLFHDPAAAATALGQAASHERGAGQRLGAEHTERLRDQIAADRDDLKALRQRLSDALEDARRASRSTHEALLRRSLGLIAILLGQRARAEALWTDCIQQLRFLDLDAEAEATRAWLQTLRALETP